MDAIIIWSLVFLLIYIVYLKAKKESPAHKPVEYISHFLISERDSHVKFFNTSELDPAEFWLARIHYSYKKIPKNMVVFGLFQFPKIKPRCFKENF